MLGTLLQLAYQFPGNVGNDIRIETAVASGRTVFNSEVPKIIAIEFTPPIRAKSSDCQEGGENIGERFRGGEVRFFPDLLTSDLNVMCKNEPLGMGQMSPRFPFPAYIPKAF